MRRATIYLLGLIVASAGCGFHPLGFQEPIAFPNAALLGSTVAIAVDSNVIENLEVDLNEISLTGFTDANTLRVNNGTTGTTIVARADPR